MMKKPRMRKRLKEKKMRRKKTCPKERKTLTKRAKVKARVTTTVYIYHNTFPLPKSLISNMILFFPCR